MEKWRDWLKESYGRKLNRLHAWNGWVVLLLAVTGILLYVPVMREWLGEGRVWLKQLHIALGLMSVVLLLLYLPLIGKHWGQIRGRLTRQSNLSVVLVLLAGWSLSGLILWQFRALPSTWSNAALIVHDLFSFVGIPYAIYHSVSRSRWLKRQDALERKQQREEGAASLAQQPNPTLSPSGADFRRFDPPWYMSRRFFLRAGFAAVLAALVGPMLYRWLKLVRESGSGTADQLQAADGNAMTPLPEPAPNSLKPLGGGAAGSFRIYTVTEIPTATSANWHFTVSGLVDYPMDLNWDDFLKLPRSVQVSDFHCVTGWSVYHCTWEGIPLAQLLQLANVKPQAKYVKFTSADGVYTDALSLDQAGMDDVMVAVLLDGKLIPQKLGGPVRLIVPKMYGYKSVKWLKSIELMDQEHVGFWEARGYDNDAWVGRSNGY